jgi:hypothetical protein
VRTALYVLLERQNAPRAKGAPFDLAARAGHRRGAQGDRSRGKRAFTVL